MVLKGEVCMSEIILSLVGVGVVCLCWVLLKPKASYKSRVTLLTNAELNFYKQLRRSVGSDKLIHQKVRLADLVEANSRDIKLLHKVQAKHVDFVITEEQTSNILLAIELDDSSHLSIDSFKRDNEKNQALKSASVPLLRVKATRKYNASVFQDVNIILNSKTGSKPKSTEVLTNISSCPFCEKTLEKVVMSFPNKGKVYKKCICGFRTEPV